MKTLQFEKGKKSEFTKKVGYNSESVLENLNRQIQRYSGDKNRIIMDMQDILPSSFKLGFGGSHIWCSNNKNERIFIVTGFLECDWCGIDFASCPCDKDTLSKH